MGIRSMVGARVVGMCGVGPCGCPARVAEPLPSSLGGVG
jgi:hypothetical protein